MSGYCEQCGNTICICDEVANEEAQTKNIWTITSSNLHPKVPYGGSSNKLKFYNLNEEIGVLDFSGPEMKFTGLADQSAKVFFDFVAKLFTARLESERKYLTAEDVNNCLWVTKRDWHNDDVRTYTMYEEILAFHLNEKLKEKNT
jgi:hypothetical protein